MPAGKIQIQTFSPAACPPSFGVPVQNIPGRVAARTNHSLNHVLASVATVAGRDRPRPQQNLRRRSVHLDHEPLAGPGDLGEERLGCPRPSERDALANAGEYVQAQAWEIGGEAPSRVAMCACSEAAHLGVNLSSITAGGELPLPGPDNVRKGLNTGGLSLLNTSDIIPTHFSGPP